MARVFHVCRYPKQRSNATLKAQFIYGGVPPKPEAIILPAGRNGGNVQIVNEELLVNQVNRGIKNVAFYLYTGRGGTEVEVPANPGKTVTLVCNNGRFDPRFVVLQVGDTLKLSSNEPVGHNVNLNFFANRAINALIPPGKSFEYKISRPEMGITRAECNICPWMSAQMLALDHPFAAVSDDDGKIEINALPSWQTLVFRINHEKAAGGIKQILVNGQSQTLKKNQMEIELKPGLNDLGVITIPAAAL